MFARSLRSACGIPRANAVRPCMISQYSFLLLNCPPASRGACDSIVFCLLVQQGGDFGNIHVLGSIVLAARVYDFGKGLALKRLVRELDGLEADLDAYTDLVSSTDLVTPVLK